MIGTQSLCEGTTGLIVDGKKKTRFTTIFTKNANNSLKTRPNIGQGIGTRPAF